MTDLPPQTPIETLLQTAMTPQTAMTQWLATTEVARQYLLWQGARVRVVSAHNMSLQVRAVD